MISLAQENPNPIIYGTLPRFEKDDAKGRFIGALDSWPGKSGTKPPERRCLKGAKALSRETLTAILCSAARVFYKRVRHTQANFAKD